ncbi:hypothetical protein P4N68_01545 [Corynebacterium felinum]|uniref:Uncharacterized protein n=1 Tax=Corynebacterium felinum TaxID=131318 RepID=A0ABU2B6Y7_9CORY|nr:hypothetical protein [Corynebacterium felinum]MDF5819764.1 hypothetical protein [Corynebacterium felinum]MDR7354370.1 hypothetical protein [Corynebacterium felinum]WJY93741.1 hypothetical protein CFELI_00420 [Corynebacterium felinum]
MALSPNRVFPQADEWFAERGYTRTKTREAIWSKTLPNGLILHFLTDPIRVTPDIMKTSMGFVIQFPHLKKLQDSIYECILGAPAPSGVLKATFVHDAPPHTGWEGKYHYLETSGNGPGWDQRFTELDRIIPTLEKEAATPGEIRPTINHSDFFKINQRPFVNVFIAIHDKDYDLALQLLNSIDGPKEVNPYKHKESPEGPSFEEQFEQVKNIFIDYINTQRKNS